MYILLVHTINLIKLHFNILTNNDVCAKYFKNTIIDVKLSKISLDIL